MMRHVKYLVGCRCCQCGRKIKRKNPEGYVSRGPRHPVMQLIKRVKNPAVKKLGLQAPPGGKIERGYYFQEEDRFYRYNKDKNEFIPFPEELNRILKKYDYRKIWYVAVYPKKPIKDLVVCAKCYDKGEERQKRVSKLAKECFFKKSKRRQSLKKVLTKKLQEKGLSSSDKIRIKQALFRLSPALSFWSSNVSEQSKQVPLDDIKLIPIGNIMPSPAKRKFGSRQTFLCPLHDEGTPSFSWEVKKNLFYCFGCQAKGSVIDLYMKLNNCDLKTAIKELAKLI